MNDQPAVLELIHFSGCPHAQAARDNLAQALTKLGLEARWTEWDLEADDLPERVRGYGSPTVLVNGVDVAGIRGRSSGMACRADGAPSVEAIMSACEAGA